jgi:peptide/nickel transport system substrate-binding protein
MAIEAEPATLVPKDACSNNGYFVIDNVYDALTERTRDCKIVGELAESFSPVDPKTWRFKLRQGITFSNGEPFNADAVMAMVSSLTDPASPGACRVEYGVDSGRKVDDFTVDIMTAEADPLLPGRLVRMPIPAPNWLTTSNLDKTSTAAVGSGAYKLKEYNRGNYILLQANEDYWGSPKPTIAEVKIVPRNEAAVRASMLQTGEVQLAYLLSPEQAKQAPASQLEVTGEVVGLRINTEQALLKDLRVRQALNLAIDRKGIIDGLFGSLAEPLNGQYVRKHSLGYNPELQEYPYDLARAKQLMQDAGAVGQSVELVSRNGVFPRSDEVIELVANQIGQTGLKIAVRPMEVVQWLETLRAVKPGQNRTDLHLIGGSDPVLDSSRQLLNYYTCGGRSAAWCDEAFNKQLNNVLGLSGDARAKGFQELWATAREQNVLIPLFGLNFMHGISPKLHWDPRLDGVVNFNEWKLDN